MTTQAGAAPRPGFLGALLALIDALRRKAEARKAAAARRATLRDLARMDARRLSDIGLTPDAVARLALKEGMRL